MRISKFLCSPILVIFVSVAFLFLVTGCEKAVTYYDKDGKPYTVKEPDPWGTIGAVILTLFVVGAIAAGASSGDGASLPVEHKTMFAYAGNKGIVYDAPSGIYNSVKCFKLIDSQGNIISEHLIDVDKLIASRSLVDVSDVQVSAKVNKRMLKKLVDEIAKANNLKSVPDTIKTEISCSADEKNTLMVNSVSIPADKGNENRISELMVMSEKGIFKVSTAMNENLSQDAGRLSVTVSQLN
jgi:hypothetical protein